MRKREALLCPSARPELTDSVVFGVVSGTIAEPRIADLITAIRLN